MVFSADAGESAEGESVLVRLKVLVDEVASGHELVSTRETEISNTYRSLMSCSTFISSDRLPA